MDALSTPSQKVHSHSIRPFYGCSSGVFLYICKCCCCRCNVQYAHAYLPSYHEFRTLCSFFRSSRGIRCLLHLVTLVLARLVHTVVFRQDIITVFQILFEGTSYGQRRGAAYGIAGEFQMWPLVKIQPPHFTRLENCRYCEGPGHFCRAGAQSHTECGSETHG